MKHLSARWKRSLAAGLRRGPVYDSRGIGESVSLQISSVSKAFSFETLLEVYFFVALLSTTGLDNLVCLTVVLIGMILARRVGGLVLSSASALIAGLAASFS
jgi:hypothetical protein